MSPVAEIALIFLASIVAGTVIFIGIRFCQFAEDFSYFRTEMYALADELKRLSETAERKIEGA